LLNRLGPIGTNLRSIKARFDGGNVTAKEMDQPVMPPVMGSLLREVVSADAGPDLVDNVDPLRFTSGSDEPPQEAPAPRLAEFLVAAAGLQRLYEHLQPGDRELLVRVLAFHVLGPRKIGMPMTLERLRRLAERAKAARVAERTAPAGIFDWWADDFDLSPLGYPIRVRVLLLAVLQIFLVEQYRCPGTPEIGVRAGDVVIDGGAYWGESALYFAHGVGPQGRVVSFEVDPVNVAAFGHNLSLNPGLAGRIEIVPAALWDRSQETVTVRARGPGTAVTSEGEGRVPTESVDALLRRGAVDRVDFIKLDIEGAELNCLKGAEMALRTFRPRLAIAAYHKPNDLAVIPEYVLGLDLGYRLRLGHTTMHQEETILFATTDE
jgi:FkbM family methyltransferase